MAEEIETAIAYIQAEIDQTGARLELIRAAVEVKDEEKIIQHGQVLIAKANRIQNLSLAMVDGLVKLRKAANRGP